MTDRIKGFVVTLEADLREDDAEAIAAAIRQLRGVAHVGGAVAEPEDHMNRARVKHELIAKMLDLVKQDL